MLAAFLGAFIGYWIGYDEGRSRGRWEGVRAAGTAYADVHRLACEARQRNS